MSEFSRPERLDRLAAEVAVEATAQECRALARRLRIGAVHSLACHWRLRLRGAVVEAEGRLAAEVEQACVLTLEPVRQTVAERFEVRFVPAGTEADGDDPESPDELPYEGRTVDLGEAAAEQLALALDPYPHAPGAVLPSVEAEGPAAQEPRQPFAALRKPS